MGAVAEPMGVAIVGERVVVGGVEARQMGEEMGDEPMELGEIADARFAAARACRCPFRLRAGGVPGRCAGRGFARRRSRRASAARAIRRAGGRRAAAATGSRGKRTRRRSPRRGSCRSSNGTSAAGWSNGTVSSRGSATVPVGTRIDASRQRSLSMSRWTAAPPTSSATSPRTKFLYHTPA